MKNPKLIVKPFAKNGQKNVIPENYETSMDSNQATWDQGFGQITMLPVAAGGLPPKGQDFNGILNQISESIVYQSKGGRFKFSPEYSESIGGYPKGAILQSDDEKKEYQSIIDNNKVNFNTATQAQINAAWKLFSTDDMLQQIAGKQPAGDYATNTALNNGLNAKFDKTSIVQITGSSTTQVMSQDAATKAFMKPGDFGLGATKTTELIKENDYTNSVGRTFGFIYNNSDAIGAPSNFGGGIVFGRDPKLSASILYSPDWTTRLYLSSAIDTTSGKMSGFVEFYSTGNTKIDRNGNLKASGSSDALTDFPVGAPIPWPQSTAPAGYLVCNGQAFNKNTYPLLAQAYPSGILPDLRGEFIRGLDAGRNIDNGRAVLSAQSDAIRNITGSIETAKSNTNGEGAFSSSTNGTTGAASDSTGSVKLYAKAVFKASDSVPTANENRPRNIAFLYIVRAA
ncbi:phage tail protein [Providencia rettgeri]